MFDNGTANGTRINAAAAFSLENLNDEIFRTYFPAVIYTAVLMMVGTPGNLIVIYIYYFKWRRSTSRMFILCLAKLDLVNCITTLPVEIYIMRYSVMLDIPLVCKLSRFMTYTMNSSSALILIGIAVDRFKRICKPYQHAFSVINSKYICIGSVLISVSITWPAIVLYGTRRIHIGNIAGTSCLIENRYDSTPFPNIYFVFMGLMTVVIFTALSMMYYFVGLQIYKHRVFKRKRCSQIEMIVEENSTEKSMDGNLANENSPNISNENGNKINTGRDNVANQEILNNGVKLHMSEKCDETDENLELKPNYHLPRITKEFSKDTSCEFSSNHNELETQSNTEDKHSQNENASRNSHQKPRRNKTRRTRVRYSLVRVSSNSSGRTKCIDYLTIRIGKSTFMLFLVTLVYIVSFLPFYILAIIRQTNESFIQQLSPANLMAYQVFLRTYLLSSAINPVIYSFCNAQFRGHCIDIFKSVFLRKSSVLKER